MPDISDTGGDTDAQSQYSWLWPQTKLKWWHFFTGPLVVYFMPNIFDTGGDADVQSQYFWLCWLQTKLKWRNFITVPQVDYFMPDISDTGGDTDAQSQYSWLWLHSNSFLCSQLFSDFWSVLFFSLKSIFASTPQRWKYDISVVFL